METKALYSKEGKLDFDLVVSLLRVTKAIHGRVFPIFREGDITPAQFSTLEVLYHNGDLKIGEIMDKILSTPGNMTVVINNLLKAKLVKRVIDQSDRRNKVIGITEKGKLRIEEIFAKHFVELKDLFNVLPREEKKLLIELLKKISKNK